jgi:hypothetical protein
MIVDLPAGDNLKIGFVYGTVKNDGRLVDYTCCQCELNRSGQKYTATVNRHRLDAPNRPVARRRALEKLLKVGLTRLDDNMTWVKDRDFNNAERTLIWGTYFKEHADLRRNHA